MKKFLRKFDLNGNSCTFFMKNEKVLWSKDSHMEYNNGSISLDLAVSFTGTSDYLSKNASIIPSGQFIGSIGKFQMSTSIKLHLVDDILTSNITVTRVGMKSFEV